MKCPKLCAALIICAAVNAVQAETRDTVNFPEIDAALTAGNALDAERLADNMLSKRNLTKFDRSILLTDRALALVLIGKRESALRDYSEAIEMRTLPREVQVNALIERGLTLEAMDRLADAISNYGEALSVDPLSATALNNRANAYRRLNRRLDARRDYIAALTTGSIRAEYPYYGLGQLSEAQGDKASAQGYYSYALAANPKFTLAAERLAALSGLRNEPDETPVVLHPPTKFRVLENPGAAQPTLRSSSSRLRPSFAWKRSSRLIAQLGAWRTEEQAAGEWARAVRIASGTLLRASPAILPLELPNNVRLYRLRVKPDGELQAFCKALKIKGFECQIVKE